ncbi:MAG TPA: hypothetical protein VF591_00170 [Pyrinomonadaceae bacterium]|jgi:hypothetical protein
MNRTILRSSVTLAASILTVVTLAAAVPTKVVAQNSAATPTPTPKSAEVLRLEEEKAQAELRKAIAEANKTELEARFPKPSTTPLDGKTTVEGELIEPRVVAYNSLGFAANQLVQQLKDAKLGIKTLVIYNERDVNLLLSYKVALNQLELMRQGYRQMLPDTPPPCPAAAPDPELLRLETRGAQARAAIVGPIAAATVARSLFGSFVDLTALLRTNVEVKGQLFDIDEPALVSEVFRAAKASDGLTGVTLFYPSVFPPNLDFDVAQMNSAFLGRLDALNDIKAYAEGLGDALEETQKEIQKTKTSIENLEASVRALTGRKQEAEAKLADLIEIYGDPGVSGGRRRRVPPEKLEVMKELKRTIAKLSAELDEIQRPGDGKLAQANQKMVRLTSTRGCLLSKLQPNFQNPDKLDDTIARLRAKNDQFAKFVEALVKADASTGLNSLTSFIKAENMLAALKGPQGQDRNFYWLQLKVVKAGGNNRIKTNPVIDVLTGGNRLSHSGGAVVEYILFDPDGKSVAADTITQYSSYIKSGKVKKLKGPKTLADKPDDK